MAQCLPHCDIGEHQEAAIFGGLHQHFGGRVPIRLLLFRLGQRRITVTLYLIDLDGHSELSGRSP
jgi:hypothetical protein